MIKERVMIFRIAEADLDTKYGLYREFLYYDGQKESIAIVCGDIREKKEVLCRIHSHCISAHVFNSIECDCREQMEMSQRIINLAGHGVIIWLDQEGRGNGHMAKLQSTKYKKQGLTQSKAFSELGYAVDARCFVRSAEILADLGVQSIKLLTNNPNKKIDLEKAGIIVSSTSSLKISPDDNPYLKALYEDKVSQGHEFS
jgi:GTP cyclohydrolase II